MLNLDMISRNGSDTLQIDGLKQNPDLAVILMSEAAKLGLKDYPSGEDMSGRSDQYNFFKKGITAVDITSGLHKDYHKVSDDLSTYDPKKAAAISKLTFKTAWIVANQKKRLKIITPIKQITQ
jgi:Zn-dependent M28 family amino/carboxypeptidase